MLASSVVAVGATAGQAASSQNIVEAGADPNGNERIDSVLEDVAADDTEIVFPEGEYRLGSFSGSYDGLVLRGNDATIVSEGGTISLSGNGWVVDGFDFDYSNVDGCPPMSPSGSGWELKNCVFRGTRGSGSGGQSGGQAIAPSVPAGSKGTIKNVYLHEGAAAPDSSSSLKAMWAGPNLEGTLHIDGVWCEHWAENTLYMHNCPGKIIVENSFFRNSNTAGTRVGGKTVLRNNTYVKDGPHPAQAWSGGRVMRGIWVSGGNKGSAGNNGRVLVEDCDFVFTHEGGSGSPLVIQYGEYDDIAVRNSRMHSTVGSAIDARAPCTLTLDGVNISGGGGISTASGVDLERNDVTVGEGREADATPPIPQPPEPGTTPSGDGGSTTPETTSGSSDSGGPSSDEQSATSETLPNLLRIDGGAAPEETAHYSFTVDGDLEHAHVEGASVDPQDKVSGSAAEGLVENYVDAYRFSGEVTDFKTDSPVDLTLNGDGVTVSSLGKSTDTGSDGGSSGSSSDGSDSDAGPSSDSSGSSDATDSGSDGSSNSDSDPLPHVVKITGNGGETNYEFSVSGELAHSTIDGATVDDGDTIDGKTASGTVYNWIDAYRFSGEIESFELAGSATVELRD